MLCEKLSEIYLAYITFSRQFCIGKRRVAKIAVYQPYRAFQLARNIIVRELMQHTVEDAEYLRAVSVKAKQRFYSLVISY